MIGEILGAVAAPLLGGLLGGSADKQAAQPRVQEVSNEPWEGIQPYLVGDTPPPAFLTQSPSAQATMPWLQWAQGSGEGANLSAPPPMMADSIRGQLGIGMPGGQQAQPARPQPQPQEQKQEQTPSTSQPQTDPWVEAFNAGFNGDVSWLNQQGIAASPLQLSYGSDPQSAAASLGREKRQEMQKARLDRGRHEG
jgi:hypothetical protein